MWGRTKGSGGFLGSAISYQMTWLWGEEDNALQNSNFDPLLQKESNFNNHCPMKWPSQQSCRLYTCLNLIRQHPEKGFICFCPECLNLRVCQVCIILPDVVFPPSNIVLHVVTMTLPSKHLSYEMPGSPGLIIATYANCYPSTKAREIVQIS